MAEANDKILEEIRLALRDGRYVFKKHAIERVVQRGITVEDAKHVLNTGNITGERWNNEFQTTNFAVEGKTLDQRNARVVIAFEQTSRGEYVVVITVIEL